ncbi:MAG: TniQ family protein [Roseiarcus sp.]
MLGRRLPVAPRPYRDELLSSWLGRVACRYGLDAASLLGALAADGEGAALSIPIDDAAPLREDIVSWAQACGVDPARLSRLTLARRRPGRPKAWFLSQGPPWAPTASRSPPACCACFESDHAAGRDEHLRADWMLAERCVCPAHRQLLRDRCPCCRGPLHFAFRLRNGRARVICGECERELAARSGREESALMEALISIQDRIGAIVSGAPERRRRLEAALSTLWAPLDDPGAARPVLALWLDESGWRCPTEAQGAIGAPFPLGRLPIALRIATLIAADAAFGLGDELLDDESDAAAFLTRRAAPLRGFPKTPRSAPAVAASARRSPTEYRRLAREILTSPEWRAAVELPERRRERVLSRLMDAALAVRRAETRAGAPVQQ